jgi:hypothetical protein
MIVAELDLGNADEVVDPPRIELLSRLGPLLERVVGIERLALTRDANTSTGTSGGSSASRVTGRRFE